MTQKEKELLLQDLCARLPYGVMVNVESYDTEKLIGIENETITTKATPTSYSDKGEYPIDIVKPYLRPMSSMTDEEKGEYYETMDKYTHRLYPNSADFSEHTEYSWTSETFDWLLKNHFDFMGLIPKGLAIEVTKENNPYEN